MSHHYFRSPANSAPLCAPLADTLIQAYQDPVLRPLLSATAPGWSERLRRCYQALTALPRYTRRSLQRQWRRSLAGIALLLALGQAPALAASINVDGTTCTLADAITAANGDTTAGGCTPAGSGPDTLTLTSA